MPDQRTVRITELAGDSEIIEYQTFEDVAFIGPAVVAPENCNFEGCKFSLSESIDSILWEVPRGWRIGGILFRHCLFRRCIFMGIGFAGTRESLQVFREHLGGEVLRRVKLFYSYSHEDSALRDELGKHLASLRRWGAVEDWYDRRILPGTDWETEIDEHIRTSDVILPLVSASFLNSDYCSGVELETALKQHEEGRARIVPVILRPCNWTPSPLGRLQVLPTDAKAITRWENQDEALVDVIKGLERVINDIRSR